MIFSTRVTDAERLTTINVLWHRVDEAHAQYQLPSESLSQWDHWRIPVNILSGAAVLCTTLYEADWHSHQALKKKKKIPISCHFRCRDTSSACPLPDATVGANAWRKKKIITIIWWLLRYDWHQNKEQSHCAFVFNFPQVFNHNMWHLLLRGLCWERDEKKAHVALFVVFA